MQCAHAFGREAGGVNVAKKSQGRGNGGFLGVKDNQHYIGSELCLF